MTMTTTAPTGPSSTVPLVGITGQLDGQYGPQIPVQALHLMIDDHFVVPAGTREQRDGESVTRLTWDAITPSFPPDPMAAR